MRVCLHTLWEALWQAASVGWALETQGVTASWWHFARGVFSHCDSVTVSHGHLPCGGRADAAFLFLPVYQSFRVTTGWRQCVSRRQWRPRPPTPSLWKPKLPWRKRRATALLKETSIVGFQMSSCHVSAFWSPTSVVQQRIDLQQIVQVEFPKRKKEF